jgi:hypothetical protein
MRWFESESPSHLERSYPARDASKPPKNLFSYDIPAERNIQKQKRPHGRFCF